jgi:hypothetical protein
MARLYSAIHTIKRKERAEKLKDLTTLDFAILERSRHGADFYEIANACRPYKRKDGVKFFAPLDKIRERIKFLKEKDFLQIG